MDQCSWDAAAVVPCIVAIPILVLALPFLTARAWLDGRRRRRLQREFRNRWGAHGKRLVLAPAAEIHRGSAELVRAQHLGGAHPFEADIFRMWAGDQEFNPLAIIIPADGAVRVIRFWQAFRDYKHGKDRTRRAAEAELEEALGVPLRAGA